MSLSETYLRLVLAELRLLALLSTHKHEAVNQLFADVQYNVLLFFVSV